MAMRVQSMNWLMSDWMIRGRNKSAGWRDSPVFIYPSTSPSQLPEAKKFFRPRPPHSYSYMRSQQVLSV